MLLLEAVFNLEACAQFDPEVAGRWSNVRFVRYEVVGDFHNQAAEFGFSQKDGPYLRFTASVRDRVAISFVWDTAKNEVIGEPTFRNFPGDVWGFRQVDAAPACASPLLLPGYDPFDFRRFFTSRQPKGAPESELVLRMIGPDKRARVLLDANCDGGSIPVYVWLSGERNTELFVPPPTLLGLPPGTAGPGVVPYPKEKVVVVRSGHWVFTHKLTAVE